MVLNRVWKGLHVPNIQALGYWSYSWEGFSVWYWTSKLLLDANRVHHFHFKLHCTGENLKFWHIQVLLGCILKWVTGTKSRPVNDDWTKQGNPGQIASWLKISSDHELIERYSEPNIHYDNIILVSFGLQNYVNPINIFLNFDKKKYIWYDFIFNHGILDMIWDFPRFKISYLSDIEISSQYSSPHRIDLVLKTNVQICVTSHIYVYLETNYMRKTAENQICPRVLYMTVAINTEAGNYSFPISNEN